MRHCPVSTALAATALAFALLFAASGARAARPYVVGVPCLTPSCSYPGYENLIREAYRRIGMGIEYRRQPLLRDLRDADSGAVDASMLRDSLVIDDYPGLLMVPVPLGTYDIAAFTLEPAPAPETPGDLAGAMVGCLRGDIAAQNVARTAQIAPLLLNDMKSALTMLDRGRINAALLPAFAGALWAERLGLRPMRVSRAFYRGFFYHCVNKGHADLVPRLNKALWEMYRDGTARRLLGDRYVPLSR